MSDWNGFGGLDLTSVQTGGGNTRLQPGRYVVVCKDAKVEEIRNTKNRKLVCDFQAEDGSGEIRFNFNIHHTSEQAQDIGKRQLKSFLVAAGHTKILISPVMLRLSKRLSVRSSLVWASHGATRTTSNDKTRRSRVF
jgi:hypothetical protein